MENTLKILTKFDEKLSWLQIRSFELRVIVVINKKIVTNQNAGTNEQSFQKSFCHPNWKYAISIYYVSEKEPNKYNS